MEVHNSDWGRPQPGPDTVGPATWRCIVCQKPTNEVHVLPCQHKFCYGCLELWAGIYLDMYHGTDGQFPCQICWKLYDVPSQGIRAFVQDYRVHALESCLEQMSFGGPTTDIQQTPATPQGNVFGHWDAATTAEAAFGNHFVNQGDISPAKTQPAEMFQAPQGMGQGGMIANINCDDGAESMMTHTAQTPSDDMMVAHTPEGSGHPAGTAPHTSMVSHMAPSAPPQTTWESQGSDPGGMTGRADYCLRSHHIHMHML